MSRGVVEPRGSRGSPNCRLILEACGSVTVRAFRRAGSLTTLSRRIGLGRRSICEPHTDAGDGAIALPGRSHQISGWLGRLVPPRRTSSKAPGPIKWLLALLCVSFVPTPNLVLLSLGWTPPITEQTGAVASNLPMGDRYFRMPARPLNSH